MPALRALCAQVAAVVLVVLVALLFLRGQRSLPPLLALASLQGLIAALVAWRLRSDRWWLPLHVLFMPAVVLTQRLPLPPADYLVLLVMLVLVYGLPFRSQVPLYLSNATTIVVLTRWLPSGPLRVLDIGSGTGRFVLKLARLRSDCQVTGIEWAPLPWWLSRLAARTLPNVHLLREDFRLHPLRDYDVVYAFLSPVPMASLWDKARREMKPGSWLVSNSFPVPEVPPTQRLQVDDRRRTQLYCYRIPSGTSGTSAGAATEACAQSASTDSGGQPTTLFTSSHFAAEQNREQLEDAKRRQ